MKLTTSFSIGNVKIKNRLVLAPMAGISNSSFRQIIKEMGVGLIYAEMVSINALAFNNSKTLKMLAMQEKERPIAQQIFGSDVETFVKAAKIVEEQMHPDIIDINMGCPVPKVALKAQAGSALLKDPQKIGEIVKAVVQSVHTPITVKIRSGWDNNSINAVEVAKIIEASGAKALTIHGRTRAQDYSGSVDLDIIKKVKESVHIPVIGNGDITSYSKAQEMLDYTGCDAVMIGRASIGNPWIFQECLTLSANKEYVYPTYSEKIAMLKKHYELLKKDIGEKRALLEIKVPSMNYIKGLPQSKIYKNKLCQVKSELEFYQILDEYLLYLKNS